MDGLKNNREAVQSLYDLYSDAVYRLAYLTMGNESDAKDVVQEVFLRVINSLDTFRNDSNVKTWLLRIAHNCIVDSFRRRRREVTSLSNYDIASDENMQENVETILTLSSLLSELKDNYRKVVILRHVENLSVQETGKILGWSANKVRITDHRAIIKLRELFTSSLKEEKTNDIGR